MSVLRKRGYLFESPAWPTADSDLMSLADEVLTVLNVMIRNRRKDPFVGGKDAGRLVSSLKLLKLEMDSEGYNTRYLNGVMKKLEWSNDGVPRWGVDWVPIKDIKKAVHKAKKKIGK